MTQEKRPYDFRRFVVLMTNRATAKRDGPRSVVEVADEFVFNSSIADAGDLAHLRRFGRDLKRLSAAGGGRAR